MELSSQNMVKALQALSVEKTTELVFVLGVQLNVLDDISTFYNGISRKIHAIQAWLDSDTEASWDKLVSGLKQIRMNAVASSVESAFIKAEIPVAVTSSSPLNSTTMQPVKTPTQLVVHVECVPRTPPTLIPAVVDATETAIDSTVSSNVSLERVAEAKATIDQLEDTFSDLLSDTRSSMSDKEGLNRKFLDKFRDHLLVIPVSKKAIHAKFFRESEDDILKAENIRKLFAILCRYCNYSNCEIILHLIKKFCEVTLQTRMVDYRESLQRFEMVTTVDIYVTAISVCCEVFEGFSRMVMKINKPASVCTLHEVRVLKEALAEKAALHSYSMYIESVDEGSVLLVLSYPPSCVEWIVSALTPDFLHAHHLTEVSVNGEHLTIQQGSTEEPSKTEEKPDVNTELLDIDGALTFGKEVAHYPEEVTMKGSLRPLLKWKGSPASSPLQHKDPTACTKSARYLMQELIETEKAYIGHLETVVEKYMPAMDQLRELPRTMVGKKNVIFSNLHQLLHFNRMTILPQLELCQQCPIKVGAIFLTNVEEFLNYSVYFKNMPHQTKLMDECGIEFFAGVQARLQDSSDLRSYLIKPFQRITKYKIFLTDMIKDSSMTAHKGKLKEYFDQLKEAHKMFDFVLRHGNDILAAESLIGFDGNLREQGKILRQGDLVVYERNRKHKRRVFLFENMVILAKMKRPKHHPEITGSEVYEFRSAYKISDFTQYENMPGHPTCFKLYKKKESLLLQAETEEEKNCWTWDLWNLYFSHLLQLKDKTREAYRSRALTGVGSSRRATLARGHAFGHSMRRGLRYSQESTTRYLRLIPDSQDDLPRQEAADTLLTPEAADTMLTPEAADILPIPESCDKSLGLTNLSTLSNAQQQKTHSSVLFSPLPALQIPDKRTQQSTLQLATSAEGIPEPLISSSTLSQDIDTTADPCVCREDDRDRVTFVTLV